MMVDMFGRMMWLPFSMAALWMNAFASALRQMPVGGEGFEPQYGLGPAWGAEPLENRSGGWILRNESKEERAMSDNNLENDRVKLVQYSIVSVKRGAEDILDRGEVIVTDEMSAEAFATWRVAVYLQTPGHRDVKHEDKKYLRVYNNVLDSWPRESLQYEEQQLDVLRGIEHAIRDCCPPERREQPAT